MTTTDPAKALAREISDLRREVRGVSRGAQLSRSSLIVDGETVTVPDAVRTGREAQETATVALGAANGKNSVTYSVDEPSGSGTAAGDIWFRRDSAGVIIGSWEWTGEAWEPRVFGDAVLDSLTVGKLVSGEIAAGQKIIAGPGNGTHAEMAATGFRVYAADPLDGVPNEVIRLGTDTNDFFGITDGNDNLLASIDETGRGSFRRLSVVEDPTVQGRALVGDILNARPKGVVAWGFATPDKSGIIAETPLMGINWTSEANRMYRVTMTGLRWSNDTDGWGNGAAFFLRDALSPGGPELGRADFVDAVPGFHVGQTWVVEIRGQVATPAIHAFHLSVAAIGTPVHAQYYGVQPYTMVIEDIGPRLPNTGNTFATPTPAPDKATYSETIPASWGQSYMGSGAPMSGAGGRLYQGQDPSGYNGNTRSLIGFPDLTAKLAGAAINKIELFLYASHWYHNAGGTAVVGAHALTSQPGSFSGVIDPNRLQSAGWPKPGGRVLDITSWGSGFKDGSVRGVVLGPGPSTDYTYYGYFNGVGQSYFPELRINYTK